MVIQATRSTPSGTRLTQYPSSRETIRQHKSRPGVRLPHFTGRCSTRARAELLARRDPRWTLREVHPESSTLVRFKSPHIPRHSRATDRRDRQIRKTRQLHGAADTGDFTAIRCPVSYYIELKGRQTRENTLGSSRTIR